MLIRDRKDVDRSAKTVPERDLGSAAKISRAVAGWSRAGERKRTGKVAWPAIDQDRLTIVSLLIIAVLSALNLVLWFPDLGALIASFNQF